MKGITATLILSGLLAACTAEDPLAGPLTLPTMPPPASAATPLPEYVERLDKAPIAVTIDAPGSCTAPSAEACK